MYGLVFAFLVVCVLFRSYHGDLLFLFFFFQAEDGIRDLTVTGVQTCALPISRPWRSTSYDDMDDPPSAQALEHGQQAGKRVTLQLAPGDQLVGDLADRPRRRRVDERQEAALDEIGRASCRERV